MPASREAMGGANNGVAFSHLWRKRGCVGEAAATLVYLREGLALVGGRHDIARGAFRFPVLFGAASLSITRLNARRAPRNHTELRPQ
jgi:hypothetical protein